MEMIIILFVILWIFIFKYRKVITFKEIEQKYVMSSDDR